MDHYPFMENFYSGFIPCTNETEMFCNSSSTFKLNLSMGLNLSLNLNYSLNTTFILEIERMCGSPPDPQLISYWR